MQRLRIARNFVGFAGSRQARSCYNGSRFAPLRCGFTPARNTCGSVATPAAGNSLERGRYAVRNMRATVAHDEARFMTTMRITLLAPLLAGCVAYKPDSFAHVGQPFPGERITVGCLDLAISRRPDMQSQAVVEYAFGNRCNKPARVDLAYAEVRGRTAGGDDRRLAPFDPDNELQALSIDGRKAGREVLAYASPEPIVQICIDVASLADRKPEQWLCLARVDQAGEPTVDTVSEVTP
jgi:hypothetical protein